MKIIKVDVEQNRRLVPVKGWASVKTALEAFAEGRSAHARAATTSFTDDLGAGRDGGMAVGMFLLATTMHSSESRIVQDLLSKAESALKQRDEYSRSYDYDGSGTPFFKAMVDISTIDREQDMYGIGLYAAYVGDKIEIGLANYLGVPRALRGVDVVVEVEPNKDGRFTFDFETIVRKLDGALELKTLTGAQIIEAIRGGDEDKSASVHLVGIHGFDVTIAPARVERRFGYSGGKKCDTWSFEGSILSGGLYPDYRSETPNAKANPTFAISITTKERCLPDGTIQPRRKKGFLKGLLGGSVEKSLSMWHPAQQKDAIALAERIASAFR